MPDSPRNVIFIVLDGLHAGMLGGYGNSWIHTAGWDQLASESFLFDQCLAVDPRLAEVYRRQWTLEGGTSLPAAWQTLGQQTSLLTDEPLVAEHPLAADFAERTLLEVADQGPADELAETHFARFFAAASERWQTLEPPFCLWLHARGMTAPWDAPWEMRAEYADVEDPAPPDWTTVPDRELAADVDPDELLGIQHAYAGQVAALDRCLGIMLDDFRASPRAADTLLVALAARGFPLGEHRRVGLGGEGLFNERVQLAALARYPDGLGQMQRSGALVTAADLGPTAWRWLVEGSAAAAQPHPFLPSALDLTPLVQGEVEALRDHVWILGERETAIRTRAWLCRWPDAERAADEVELYSKPADRWEASDVTDRMPHVLAGFRDLFAARQAAGAEAASTSADVPLPAILSEVVE